MDLDVRDCVIAVLGGSSGIGAGVARLLASEGGSVVLGARREQPLAMLVAELRDTFGVDAHGVAADLSLRDGCDRIVARVEDAFGRLDAVVCCVGSTPLGDFAATTDDTWTRSFQMKFLSTVRAIRSTMPLLARSGGGSIVVVGGYTAIEPDPLMVTSGAINSALGNLVTSVASELADSGIRINVVHPGAVRTQRLENLLDVFGASRDQPVAKVEQDLRSRSLTGSITEVEEVARMVALLVSPTALQVTGSAIPVSTGQDRRYP